MIRTLAFAACAAVNASSTSSRGRAAIQAPTMASSSSACSARVAPAPNHGCVVTSGWPTSVITRSAMDCDDVETATQEPSAVA